jgi:prefoldin subunit 5
MQDLIERNYPISAEAACKARRLDITIQENIDEQISNLEARVKELKETRERLASTGLLAARIEDLRKAMQY